MRGEQMALHFCRSSTLTHTHTQSAQYAALPDIWWRRPFDFHDSVSTFCILSIIRAFTMAVRRPSPQEKQETADMEPVSDAHMMLIDRWLPRVSHTQSGSVLNHNAVLQGITARLQRLLYDLGHTWSWPCDGVEYLFFWQDHAYNITIRIKCDHFKG